MVTQNSDGDTPAVDSETPISELAATDATDSPAPSTEQPQPTVLNEPTAEVTPTPEPSPQPVAETELSPEEPAPAPLPPSAADRQRLADLEKQVRSYEENQAQQYLADEARNYQQQLLQNGQYDEQAANQIAAQHYQARMEAWANFKARGEIEQSQNARIDVALRLAETHGVSARELMKLGSTAEMERQAISDGRIAKLEAQLDAQRKGTVPPQSFDSGQGAVGGPLEGEALEQAVGNGTVELTPEVTQRLITYQKSQGFGG
jgi:hypothetical protein